MAAIPVTTDVSIRSEVDEMVYAAKSAFGRVDIMVNNAGFTHRNGSMLDVDEATFDLIAGVNMKAIYYAARAVVPIMERQGGGSIITTASTAGLRPRPGLTWYNASKGWTITATKSMAVELGRHGVTANCICPGPIDTAMTAAIPDGAKQTYAHRRVPLRRYGSPEEVAHMTLSLCLPAASYVNGAIIPVDGGMSIRHT